MSDKSNKYGYVGVDIPTQSFGSNKGVFNPAEINELVADNKWTSFGQLELIETQTVSASSTADFTSIDESNYNVHFMTFNNVQASSGQDNFLRTRFFESGTIYTGSTYQWAFQYGSTGGAFGETRNTATNYISLHSGGNNNVNFNGYVYFYNLGDNTKYSFTTSHHFTDYDTTGQYMFFQSGVMPRATLVNGIRIYVNDTSTFSADISLYGIRYS